MFACSIRLVIVGRRGPERTPTGLTFSVIATVHKHDIFSADVVARGHVPDPGLTFRLQGNAPSRRV